MNELATQGMMPKILELETLLRAMNTGVSLPVEHYHIDGVYVRSLFIPAGVVLTGRIHNKETISILAQGTIQVTSGDAMKVVSAPQIFVEQPGIKRAGYAVTDCTFINVFKDTDDLKNMGDEEKLNCLSSETFEEFEVRRLV